MSRSMVRPAWPSPSFAQSKGVTLISYDRATFPPTERPTTSASTMRLSAELNRHGFLTLRHGWNVPKPQVFVLNGGEDTDPTRSRSRAATTKIVWSQSAKNGHCGRDQQPGNDARR